MRLLYFSINGQTCKRAPQSNRPSPVSLTKPFQISLLALLLMVAGNPVLAAGPARRPNILHLHADDHRPDGLHELGNPLLKTPDLDKLVERGTTFTHCYTQGSMIGGVCLPSRTMMLTGRSWLRIEGQTDVAAYLPKVIGAAGYETWHMGKGGNEFKPGLAAFDTNL